MRAGESAVRRRTEHQGGCVKGSARVPGSPGANVTLGRPKSALQNRSQVRTPRGKRFLARSFLLQTSRRSLHWPQPALGYGASKAHLHLWGLASRGEVSSARQQGAPMESRSAPGSSLHSRAPQVAPSTAGRRPGRSLAAQQTPPRAIVVEGGLGRDPAPSLVSSSPWVWPLLKCFSSAPASRAELQEPGHGGKSHHD